MLNTGVLANRTMIISGGSRGIGKAIAIKAARDGAKVVIAAKTAEPHPKLPGTIYTAAKERQLGATSALMSGKLSVAGDLAKAARLDKVMSRINNQRRSIHTTSSSAMVADLQYRNVDELERQMEEEGRSVDQLSTLEAVRRSLGSISAHTTRTSSSSLDHPMPAHLLPRIDTYREPSREQLAPSCAGYAAAIGFEYDVDGEERQVVESRERRGIIPESAANLFRQTTSFPRTSSGMHQKRNFCTSTQLWNTSNSPPPPPAKYKSVEEVFDRIAMVADKSIVEQVKAVYAFDVDGKGKYCVDFKNGDGSVGPFDEAKHVGDEKPDVTIKMNVDNFMQIFNRELSPATAFMTGKIKVSGDLSKALTLEKVMKAAREAAEKSATK